VLSGRGLCDELITRPEESYRLWCVVVCDLETSRICAPYIYIYIYIYDISSIRVNEDPLQQLPCIPSLPIQSKYSWTFRLNLMFLDPCIIAQFIKKNQQDATVYQNFIISYLYEAQHVSGDKPPIIRSLKLHWQPLVFHTRYGCWTCRWWTLSGTVDTVPDNVHHLHVQQPFAYEKPEAASAVLDS